MINTTEKPLYNNRYISKYYFWVRLIFKDFWVVILLGSLTLTALQI